MGQEEVYLWLKKKREQSERYYTSIQIERLGGFKMNIISLRRVLRCLVSHGEIEIKFIPQKQCGYMNGYKPAYRCKLDNES